MGQSVAALEYAFAEGGNFFRNINRDKRSAMEECKALNADQINWQIDSFEITALLKGAVSEDGDFRRNRYLKESRAFTEHA